MANSKVFTVPAMSPGQSAWVSFGLGSDRNVGVVRDPPYSSAIGPIDGSTLSRGDHVHVDRPKTTSLAESIARKCLCYTKSEVEEGLAMGLTEEAILSSDRESHRSGRKLRLEAIARLHWERDRVKWAPLAAFDSNPLAFMSAAQDLDAASRRLLENQARSLGLDLVPGEMTSSLYGRILHAYDERRERLAGLAAILAWLASPAVVRAVARQRVDRAIADYRGPFARAVAAGLRAASDMADLSETEVVAMVAALLAYEQARPGTRRLRWHEDELPARAAAVRAWHASHGGSAMEPLAKALNRYERERARC